MITGNVLPSRKIHSEGEMGALLTQALVPLRWMV